MPRAPAVAVEYSHQSSEGVCQILILTDTASSLTRRAKSRAQYDRLAGIPLMPDARRRKAERDSHGL
jgi:hypothetical protein